MPDDPKTQIFEDRFWLRIMIEHLFIIMGALSYREKDEFAEAESILGTYNDLMVRIWEPQTDDQIQKLHEEAYKATERLRKFKLHLLSRQLTGSLAMNITSGLTSRLINEAEWYMDILATYLQKKKFIFNPVNLHILWLIDAAGHAEIIANGLNYSDTELVHKTLSYQKEFKDLYVRAYELKGFQRIGSDQFQSFDQFNEDVNQRLTAFTEFFVELNAKIIVDKIPNTVSPMMLDHMYREECYYLTELSKVSKIRPPVCDPTVQGFELPK